jgi:hypothetical protein
MTFVPITSKNTTSDLILYRVSRRGKVRRCKNVPADCPLPRDYFNNVCQYKLYSSFRGNLTAGHKCE